jgi:anhydro-N-acetylmuramic acid kinase
VKVIGLMSGTSLDGVDVALLEVNEGGGPGEAPDGLGAVCVSDHPEGSGSVTALPNPRWEMLAFRTYPYSGEQRTLIREALASGGVREIAHLHVRIGEWFAGSVNDFLKEMDLDAGDIAALGSHGQTVWHDPPTPEGRGVSLQVGCPATLAERTGIAVVSDFRSRDLAAGGHGAPLVPWSDRIFFSSADGPRAVQNLGGMANVTWLPKAGDPVPVLAFDTGPGIALLDLAAQMATDGREAFDSGGELALRGRVSRPVLARALAHPFFQLPPPRSTGREVFGPEMVQELVKEFESELGTPLTPGDPESGWPDVLATLTALTAESMGSAYQRWVVPRGVEEVFLMGGGARNPALVKAIREELSPIPIRSGEALGIDPDAREAAAFALLAWAHLCGIPANVPEATGSEGPRVLGSLTPGKEGGGR